MHCRNGSHAVTENFEAVDHVYEKECKQNSECEHGCREDCHPMPGPSYPAKALKRIALFHYVTRCDRLRLFGSVYLKLLSACIVSISRILLKADSAEI